jgi:hypothetical protein
MNVVILHYAAPPVVGGVEQTIYHHARHLADAGHVVRVIAGVGEPFDPRVQVTVAPEFGSRHPDALAVKAQLDCGEVTLPMQPTNAQADLCPTARSGSRGNSFTFLARCVTILRSS